MSRMAMGAAALCFVFLNVQAYAAESREEWNAITAHFAQAEGAGDSASAVALAERALALAQNEFGPHDPDTIISMGNLATAFYNQGRFDKAERMNRAALDISSQNLGSTHPSTLSLMNNLAFDLVSLGKYREAEVLDRRALALHQATFGPSHPETLAVMDNLGVVLNEEGRYAEAEQLHSHSLDISSRALGPYDRHTLVAMNDLANDLMGEGRYDDSERLLRKVFDMNSQVFGESDSETITSAVNLASALDDNGKYEDSAAIYKRMLEIEARKLGANHPKTLTIMNDLGSALEHGGHYFEAETILTKAVTLRSQVLGAGHPYTIVTMGNLATALDGQGRFRDAEELARKVLRLSEQASGALDPATILDKNNLASVLEREGKYGEAEVLDRQALDQFNQVLGPKNPLTLGAIKLLASVLLDQERFGDAESLSRRALGIRREVLGPQHPDTLSAENDLAMTLEVEGRNGEAEALIRECLALSQRSLGTDHPQTLIVMNNLASVLALEGRYREAELMSRDTLRRQREVLGPLYPETLTSLSNVASDVRRQKKFDEASALYRQVVDLRRQVLGPSHPETIEAEMQLAKVFVARGSVRSAIATLQHIGPLLLNRLGIELYTTQSSRARNLLLRSQVEYQDIALSLAQYPEAGGAGLELALSAVLRFKSVSAEEDAYVGRHAHEGKTPEIRVAANDLQILHNAMARLMQGHPTAAELSNLTAAMDAKQTELGQLSRSYGSELQVQQANVKDIYRALPEGSALLEIREYHKLDFTTDKVGELRWAGILVTKFGSILVHDLGAIADSNASVGRFLISHGNSDDEAAAGLLYQQILAPFSSKLSGITRLYVAPDGQLNLIPFGMLATPDGRLAMDGLDIRMIQTGRDLLRQSSQQNAKGLVAVGGLDYDHDSPAAMREPRVADGRYRRSILANNARGFPPLRSSKREVTLISNLYAVARPDEGIPLRGEDATPRTSWLLALPPPRVLHLATHGFYLGQNDPSEQPMMLAGVALAGANIDLRSGTGDGMLYALEAQDLNLEGTELVVLSACQTALGQYDYGDGMSGLVRALRVAGARYVLVALRSIDDAMTVDFMRSFYVHWLSQSQSDPAAALRETQIEFSKELDANRDWTGFMIVGN